MRGVRHRRQRPEAAIHAAVCDHLHLRARFKRMGVLAGASDLLLWHRGNSFALELKSPGGRLSDAQLEFLARFNDAGGHGASAEGVDRAIACLEGWGLLVGRRQ
jgi:VRR-NUC domain